MVAYTGLTEIQKRKWEREGDRQRQRDREQCGIYKNMRGSALEVIPEGIKL